MLELSRLGTGSNFKLTQLIASAGAAGPNEGLSGIPGLQSSKIPILDCESPFAPPPLARSRRIHARLRLGAPRRRKLSHET